MLKQRKIRFLMVGMAIALLAAAMPLAALASEAASFSGDDAYDRAAGGAPESAFAGSAGLMKVAAASFSGDDLYDLAAGGDPASAFASEMAVNSWNPSNPNLALLSAPMTEVARSSDEQDVVSNAPYRDPATGAWFPSEAASLAAKQVLSNEAYSWNPSNPSLALLGALMTEVSRAGGEQEVVSSAPYRDPATGAWFPTEATSLAARQIVSDEAYSRNPSNPNLALHGTAGIGAAIADAGNSSPACDATGYDSALASKPGTYSGDDYYDPAAGGTPEQTVFAYAVAYGKLMACAPGDTMIQ